MLRTMWGHVLLLVLSALLGCHGNLNIYITKQETMRLLGEYTVFSTHPA
jgi:hypothetical protein